MFETAWARRDKDSRRFFMTAGAFEGHGKRRGGHSLKRLQSRLVARRRCGHYGPSGHARSRERQPRQVDGSVVATRRFVSYSSAIRRDTHPEMVINFPSADMTRPGTRPTWWPEGIVFEVFGNMGSIASMQRVRAVLQTAVCLGGLRFPCA